MAITIGINIASLIAQKNLNDATSGLSKSFERLSSGLRVNSAKDDAAGLAVAMSLNADARIFNQAIRNINDGVSALNISEGALSELASITMRQRELATQAANGSYSFTQRKALNTEANALVDEYNRIIQSTTYNGRRLFDTTSGNFDIQAGNSSSASSMIRMSIGTELSRTVGNLDLYTLVPYTTGDTVVTGVTYGDLNRDGFIDIVANDYSNRKVDVLLGNGDGTFRAYRSYATTGILPRDVSLADFNGDGNLDVATADYTSGTVSVLLGNSDGSLRAATTYVAGANSYQVLIGDYNGDGRADIVSVDYGSTSKSLLINNGDGTFLARTAIDVGYQTYRGASGDFNNDGILDLAFTGATNEGIKIFLGNGNGTFRQPSVTYGSGSVGGFGTSASDFNGDGNLDIVVTDQNTNTYSILLGNGDGSLKAAVSYATGAAYNVTSIPADLNGDGIPDLILSDQNNSRVRLIIGNGDGTFRLGTSFGGMGAPVISAGVDLNRDGALDIISGGQTGGLGIYIAKTTEAATTPRLDLYTQSSARDAMTILDSALERITAEQGAIGAIQSRFEIAANNLRNVVTNYTSAASRIMDVDVAEETAIMVRKSIAQQAAAAILAQANQQPKLVLALLSNDI